MIRFPRRISRATFFRAAFISILVSLIFLISTRPGLITDIGYYTRPIWDKNPETFQLVPHYYADDLDLDTLCRLHGWTYDDDRKERPKVYDTVIFSVELDLLEIRLHELWDVVDMFVIVESNSTFTGVEKPMVFQQNRERFKFAESKIYYKSVYQSSLPPGESPFYNERNMRFEFHQALNEAGIQQGDWLIISDVDEIIRGKTIQLLTQCSGVPDIMHLQLRNYMYSFEFYVDNNSWRAVLQKYDPNQIFYNHGYYTTSLLVDAGWHCSFCFRFIADFQFKMQSYSHNDRVRTPDLLESDRIQRVICEGSDIFEYPPEAYTYKDLFSRLGNIPSYPSAVGLPNYLLSQADKFKFLLPGHCERKVENPDLIP